METRNYSAFENARPRILGAFLDADVAGLNNAEVQLIRLPRMPDFARWAVCTEEALGFPSGTFMGAYDQNRRDASSMALDSSSIVTPLIAFIEIENGWNGTALDLLRELERRSDPAITRTRAWPKSVRSFAGILRRLAPNLRAEGIAVSFVSREGEAETRLIVIERLR
jgi:hypothetical protein